MGIQFCLNNYKLQTIFFITILFLNIGTITTSNVFSYQSNYPKAETSLIKWNNLLNKITSELKLPPPEVSRIYALLHVSIYDSLLIANNKNINSEYQDIVSSYAAFTLLKYLFPSYTHEITFLKNKIMFNNITPNLSSENIKASKLIGIQVGNDVIDYSKNDNSDVKWDGKIPMDDCVWDGMNPVLSMAGFWKTYILETGAEIQPPPPFKCNSSDDLKELDIVNEATRNLTLEQIETIHYWGDKSPPIIWNDIMKDFINTYHVSFFDAAYLAAYLNIGMYDAFVSTWYTKYDHWTARPDQRIQDFQTTIPTPNFPAYTSGHSVISNVAAKILGEVFYNDKNYLESLANEASISRLWAGIHFEQDIVQGKEQGMMIAEKIIDDMNKPLHTFIGS